MRHSRRELQCEPTSWHWREMQTGFPTKFSCNENEENKGKEKKDK